MFSNRLSMGRLRGLALLTLSDLVVNGVSGVMTRSVGLCWDIRCIQCMRL